MKDVTEVLNRYRECVRGLWNNYFVNQDPSNVDWDLSDEFEKICVSLFNSLVLNRVGRGMYSKSTAFNRSQEPLNFFRVVPSAQDGVPILVSREKGTSPYWDHPTTRVSPNDADLRFIDFFDFGTLDFREFQYCRVRIVGSQINPDLVGRDALLECKHVNILFDESV